MTNSVIQKPSITTSYMLISILTFFLTKKRLENTFQLADYGKIYKLDNKSVESILTKTYFP